MRILRVHNRYQHPGGEDAVFEAEIALLASNGEIVDQLVLTNASIPAHRSPWDTGKLALSTVWSLEGRRKVRDSIASFRPDIVHFDNTFPLISPAAYVEARGSGLAVVQTLHNFRLLCPNGLFFRDGQPCEDCLGKTPPFPGVVHACYRESRIQTAVVATMLTAHRARRTWSQDVDRYIALNPLSKSKFVAGGLPEDRVVIKPNFVEDPLVATYEERNGSLVYVGRLSEEKGILTVLEAWTRDPNLPSLSVLGDGPLGAKAQQDMVGSPNLRLAGRQPREAVIRHMATASALVFPSVCYENFPVAIAEAFACATPVIASRLGAMAEIVEDGVTGLLFEPGNAEDLAVKVRWSLAHPNELRVMGENARNEYERKYTPERNYRMLMDIYADAIEHRRHSPS